MIQLKLNWFGNTQARIDELDGSNNNVVNFTFNGVNYAIPETVYNYDKGVNNWLFGIGDQEDAQVMLAYTKYYIATNGNTGTKDDFISWAGANNVNVPAVRGWDIAGNWENFKNSLNTNLRTEMTAGRVYANGSPITSPGGSTGVTPVGTGGVDVDEARLGAFNQYYQDVYSLAPGTGGAEMLGRLEQSYMNQAQQQATMADVGFQQAALQQAATVKQITDQVRGERMARLRAGMSESQIANQDMQMLMANVNTLNQNAAMLNDQRLQAQIGMNTAQDQAYSDFLNQANARGQIATGMAAADAGDAYQQTIRQMTTLYGNNPANWTSQQWQQVSREVTGYNPNAK